MDTDVKVPAAIPNMELVDQVFQKIREDLNRWNQTGWAEVEPTFDSETQRVEFDFCNTKFCFGGWALSISNRLRFDKESGSVIPVNEEGFDEPSFSEPAAKLLGFNEYLWQQVFYNYLRDIDEFEAHVRDCIRKYGLLTEDEVDTMFNQLTIS